MVPLVLILSCLPANLLDFALPKWKADRNVQIEDAYKWTYQATRGGEHAAPDKESARKWLETEWVTLKAAQENEKLWEPLCPGGEIGRFNLRPYRDGGGSQENLIEAFIASSNEYRSEPETFTAAWAELGRRLKKHPAGNLNLKAWAKLDAEMAARGYPAVHHSETYNKAAAPAYRVLTLAQAQKLGITDHDVKR